MKRFACLPLLFVGVGFALADDVPLNQPFAFRLEEPTLRSPPSPLLKTPPAESAYPALPQAPERETAPPNSFRREFNGQTYYLILL